VSVSLTSHDSIVVASIVEQVGEEVLRFRTLLLVVRIPATETDELGKSVRSQVAVRPQLSIFSVPHQVAGEGANAIALFQSNLALLEVSEELDARPIVLNNAIDHGKGPLDEFLIAAD